MPKRTDIKRVLVIGSGPIVIGQACEFDYSGTQACKALRDEGLEVILVNSNPATIMTDPEIADRTYVEPLTPEFLAQIIERERPDALLPTVGGQTALNLAIAVAEDGTLAKFGVELIGASVDAIMVAEDRLKFRDAMREIGADVPDSRYVRSMAEALEAVDAIGFPVIVRPSFTLGGVGGGIAYNIEEFREIAGRGLDLSPVHEVLLEESVIGWKEFELEVMRDSADNFVVICSNRERRPDGCAHRRQHHGRPRADPHRPRVPADARSRPPDHPARRRGDGRLQHPVRDQPGRRPDHRHRDEPARVALVGARVEGDRFSDRENRRQARARLPPGRDSQRHHAAHARFLRADDRLRGRQGPALDVREVSARRPHPDDTDEVGRRGHGHRPDVQGSLHEGLPLARTGRGRPALRTGRPDQERGADRGRRRRGAPARVERAGRPPHVGRLPRVRSRLDRGRPVRADENRPVVPDAVRADRRSPAVRQPRRPARDVDRHAPDAQARRLQRPRAGGLARVGRGRRAQRAHRARHRLVVQAHRHLRGRVRVLHTVPLRHLREGVRGRSRPHARRSSSSEAARTGSARGSSSTTAAATPPSRCAKKGSRPS